MVIRVHSCRNFEQRCGKPSMQYISPDDGLDQAAFWTDKLIHKQCIHHPVWKRLSIDTGAAGQIQQLSNQYVKSFLTDVCRL